MNRYHIRIFVAFLTFSLSTTMVTLLKPIQAPKVSKVSPANFEGNTNLAFGRCENQTILDFQKGFSDSPESVELSYRLGEAYYNLHCYQEAIKYYETTIALDPKHESAYGDLAYANDNLGRYKEAIAAAEKGLKQHPNNAFLLIELGWIYDVIGQPHKAISYLQKSIKADPNDPYPHSLLGSILASLDRKSEAIKAARKAVELNNETFDESALINAGVTFMRFDLNIEAEQAFDTLIQNNPNYGLAHYYSGLLHLQTGDYKRASDMFERHLTSPVESLDEYFERAWANLYLRRGELAADEAKNFLESTKWEGKNSAYAAVLVAFGYLQANRKDEAQKIINEAAEKCERSSWSYRLIQYLHGKLTAEELIAKGKDLEEKTEARVVIAFNLLHGKEPKKSILHLEWIKNKGAKSTSGYGWAIMMMERLQNINWY